MFVILVQKYAFYFRKDDVSVCFSRSDLDETPDNTPLYVFFIFVLGFFREKGLFLQFVKL